MSRLPETEEADEPWLEPVPAAVLASLERERRGRVAAKGRCTVGCGEVDGVLLGGLERGVVVGVSSEGEFGLLLSLQLIAKTLCDGLQDGKRDRALIVSTEPTGTVVRMLRDAVAAHTRGGGRDGLVKEALGLVSVVRVFDITGLSEVLGELDVPSREAAPSKGEEEPRAKVRDEIPDSDDDTSPSPSPSPPPAPKEVSGTSQGLPDMILITHFSTLLTTLFTQAEKTSAHNTLHLLSSRLRHLSRTLPSDPLILLSNTTTTSSADTRGARPGENPRGPDRTLRSVFSAEPYAGSWQKPSFGLVFSQFLDVHLLCTRVPRGRADAEGVVVGRGRGSEVWVVEVLLDEGGAWEGRGERSSREGRWGVVDFVGGRVVDAFGVGL